MKKRDLGFCFFKAKEPCWNAPYLICAMKDPLFQLISKSSGLQGWYEVLCKNIYIFSFTLLLISSFYFFCYTHIITKVLGAKNINIFVTTIFCAGLSCLSTGDHMDGHWWWGKTEMVNSNSLGIARINYFHPLCCLYVHSRTHACEHTWAHAD